MGDYFSSSSSDDDDDLYECGPGERLVPSQHMAVAEVKSLGLSPHSKVDSLHQTQTVVTVTAEGNHERLNGTAEYTKRLPWPFLRQWVSVSLAGQCSSLTKKKDLEDMSLHLIPLSEVQACYQCRRDNHFRFAGNRIPITQDNLQLGVFYETGDPVVYAMTSMGIVTHATIAEERQTKSAGTVIHLRLGWKISDPSCFHRNLRFVLKLTSRSVTIYSSPPFRCFSKVRELRRYAENHPSTRRHQEVCQRLLSPTAWEGTPHLTLQFLDRFLMLYPSIVTSSDMAQVTAAKAFARTLLQLLEHMSASSQSDHHQGRTTSKSKVTAHTLSFPLHASCEWKPLVHVRDPILLAFHMPKQLFARLGHPQIWLLYADNLTVLPMLQGESSTHALYASPSNNTYHEKEEILVVRCSCREYSRVHCGRLFRLQLCWSRSLFQYWISPPFWCGGKLGASEHQLQLALSSSTSMQSHVRTEEALAGKQLSQPLMQSTSTALQACYHDYMQVWGTSESLQSLWASYQQHGPESLSQLTPEEAQRLQTCLQERAAYLKECLR
jgi:hypothetical protein